MRPPCEIVVKKFLPQIRSLVALELKEKYHLSVNAIAELIGTSNAAISQYLHGVRGSQNYFLNDFPEILEFVKSISKELYENREKGMELTQKLGEICYALSNNKLFIQMCTEGKDTKRFGLCFHDIEK